jgi:hypothetical protein
MRRTISNPRDFKDIDWSEQTIEVTETVEQPVVNSAPQRRRSPVEGGSTHVVVGWTW